MRRTQGLQLGRDQQLAHLQKIVHPEQRAAFYRAFVDPKAVDLATAENVLLLPFLQQKAFVNLGPVGLNTIKYPMMYPYDGGSEILESVASFLSTQWNVEASADNMYGSSGVIAALEVIALALFNPGDEVLVPAPMFYGFPWSFSQKTVAMNFIAFQIDGGVNLTAANVAAALKQHPKAKLLVLTNPNNPLGIDYSKDLLEEIYALFLADPSRHVISDEIYGCSQVEGGSFVSALALDAYKKFPNQIHVTWGLSKDFGLAGFRAGFLISNAVAVQTALEGSACGPIPSWYASEAWFAPFVTLNPYMLQKLFFAPGGAPDPTLANEAMVVYKGLLQKQYDVTAKLLTQGDISYFQGNTGAIFFWLDLRKYLHKVPSSVQPSAPLCSALYTYDDLAERRLMTYIQDHGVQLIRGQECFNEEPGYFRLCYTAVSEAQVVEGVRKMIAALHKLE